MADLPGGVLQIQLYHVVASRRLNRLLIHLCIVVFERDVPVLVHRLPLGVLGEQLGVGETMPQSTKLNWLKRYS